MIEHEFGGKNHRCRICYALARNVWRATVDRLEDGTACPDVRSRRHSQPPDEAAAQIGYDVTVKILAQQDIKLVGIDDELHAQGIDNDLIIVDARITLGNFSTRLQE